LLRGIIRLDLGVRAEARDDRCLLDGFELVAECENSLVLHLLLGLRVGRRRGRLLLLDRLLLNQLFLRLRRQRWRRRQRLLRQHHDDVVLGVRLGFFLKSEQRQLDERDDERK
jgi:hypothetical protein